MLRLLLLPLLASFARAAAPATRAQYLMGTVCEIAASGPRAGEGQSAAFAEIARWDRILSLYKKESELSRLNAEAAAAPYHCSASMWEALNLSVRASRDTNGAFDATILPVLRDGPGALASVGYAKLELDPAARTVRFPRPGMGLDFGGIGKGLALDHAVAELQRAGVPAAMINFGGQIIAYGALRRIRVPGLDAPIEITDASVSTSGNEERPGHISSPYTGEAILDRAAITVIAPTGAEADAWSTALFVLGRVPPDFPFCALGAGAPPSPGCARYLPDNHAKGASK